ncbi:MAG: helix-turn-helix domain-containing protein [Ruminococcaceae bacterium]|nr:helix-turn-helix domain-containing protein [Oscillospiraceae bacterium]
MNMNRNAISPYIHTAMHSTIAAQYVIKTRVLFDYELIYVRGGSCTITVDGTAHHCRKNDVVLIRPGVPHSFQCGAGQDFVQPHIHFDLIYSDQSEKRTVSFKNRGDMSTEELSLISDDILAGVPIPTVFRPMDADRFQRLFFDVIHLYVKKPPHYELLYKARLIELVTLILEQFEQSHPAEKDTRCSEIAAVKSFIDANFLQPITLDSLSGQFHVNKYTLTRNFRRHYHQSVILYCRSLRIEYAKNLLRTTNRSISAIGEELGFSDIYSFSRFFHSFTGLSPKAFRDAQSR